ncbi:site-specific DNA-methyltransferase [Heyndrickxia coagulans]|uniref:site-specific DNA-methyltransferase n=1 Tax=Heyndrickxia coagulans TaxID=1398 RepID=UPI002E1FD6E1|nr:site-specific DNA-methyltransferase [Heyndrickxia coagulans]
MKTKINQAIKEVLEQFGENYFIDGQLNKHKVIQDLDAYDKDLLSVLIENETIKENFTIEINGHMVLQTNKLIELFEADEYWQDSYTKYSKKIGLTAGGKFIDESTDVVLGFPYKDTILKASMSKEDTDQDDLRPDEPFLNEVIAKEEIDVLLDKKILVNAKKYDENGVREINRFDENDNLIIKGNNLLALHTIKERYAGKVKLIYIDPPFNTGKDSFKYNDKFSRSTWLTFMKNRLEVAKELLTEDGNIFIHIDDNQAHYLKVLLDSIFGEKNFVEEIIWAYGSASGGRSASAKPVNIHDYILHYAKNYSIRKANKIYTPYSEKYIKEWFKYDDGDGRIYRRRHRGTDENGNIIWEKQYLDESKGVPLTTVWDDIKQIYANPQAYKQENKATSEIELDFGNSGQKPEKLIKRIIEMSTDEEDIVLDFFIGSGTTPATAMKMKRRFIGVEQIDNQINISINRLNDVINKKQSGISKEVNWQGGGSFVYVELMEKNQGFLKAIRDAKTPADLRKVFNFMLEEAEIDFRVDLEKVRDTLYELSLEDKKKTLFKIIDKNQLYYNYSEIDDENVRDLISDHDYAFNKSFYERGGE